MTGTVGAWVGEGQRPYGRTGTELLADWELAQQPVVIRPIPPLR